MNNQSIGLGNNETFYQENCTILTDVNTKISDASREYRELDGEIYKTIEKSGNVSGYSNNNTNNNNTNNSIGILTDDIWANQKVSRDNSLNFQRKLDQFKKKENTRTVNKKNTITFIRNPLKGSSQFKMKSNAASANNELQLNTNFSQEINNEGNGTDADYEDETLATDDVPSTTEFINKLHINSVKTNNLREINNMNSMFGQNNRYNKNRPNHLEGKEESNSDYSTFYEESYKKFNPKFLEMNINLSTRFSTNESNESFDSSTFNKMRNYEDKFTNNKSNFKINESTNQIIKFPQVNQINFCGTPSNQINKKSNYYSKSPVNLFTSSNENALYLNNNNMNYNNFMQNIKNKNLQNLPENAFSFNFENPLNNKSLSEKKKKKSKDEVDQTIFIINTDNVIYGRDIRTTIMIRHIPNKYSTQSLLEEINSNFKGKYDLFYLPMDFENQCNLGYAFINFVDPLHILMFYEVFKARKWKKYKSQKECDLSYAKFQGKVELTSHLEKSCVINKMGEDKKPVIIIPPDPLPKIQVPKAYAELYKTIHPHLVNKAIF